jgi:hypothetical protein
MIRKVKKETRNWIEKKEKKEKKIPIFFLCFFQFFWHTQQGGKGVEEIKKKSTDR